MFRALRILPFKFCGIGRLLPLCGGQTGYRLAESQKKIMTSTIQKWIIGIFVLLIYVPAFLWMWDRWFARDSYYSHGILIPFVCAYLIWQKMDVLKKIKPESSPWGLRLFFLGIAINLLSALFRVYFAS